MMNIGAPAHVPRPQDVHAFWFADALATPAAAQARNAVWFHSARDFDGEIRNRFAPAIGAAVRGELKSWEDTPQSCVSLVVVLDQFPRNVYRNTAAAFAHDAVALAVTKRALAAGYLDTLSVPERIFLLMPYQHVEDADEQRNGVRLFQRVYDGAPDAWKPFLAHHCSYQRGHCALIERFGRFPHRNRVLGRTSTPEEEAYLASSPDTFGQGAG